MCGMGAGVAGMSNIEGGLFIALITKVGFFLNTKKQNRFFVIIYHKKIRPQNKKP